MQYVKTLYSGPAAAHTLTVEAEIIGLWLMIKVDPSKCYNIQQRLIQDVLFVL